MLMLIYFTIDVRLVCIFTIDVFTNVVKKLLQKLHCDIMDVFVNDMRDVFKFPTNVTYMMYRHCISLL